MDKMLLHKNLGEFLKTKRKENNITQAEVATKLGLSSPQFVSNFERGLCSPPLKDLKLLIKLYKLDSEEILKLILMEEERRLRKALSGKKKSSMTH